MANYKKLIVWQKSMDLVMKIYDICDTFPDHERFGLMSQMERAAVSIPSNIAEGYGRQSDKELYHFLSISRGSVYELQTQLYIAAGRDYIDGSLVDELDGSLNEIGKMLSGLMKKCATRFGAAVREEMDDY